MQINLTPDPSLLAIMVIFILNYLVVRKFFLQPINQVLDERETESKTAERLHEEAMARFNEATNRIEQQLQQARRDASQLRDRYRADAAARRATMLEKTHADAKTVIGSAETKLADEVRAARETIVRDSEQLARLAAERLLGRPL